MMLIRNSSLDEGVFFAIWPRRVPEGWAVGWLHYEWVPSWGWGSSPYWRYRQLTDIERAEHPHAHRHDLGQEPDLVFTTPPDKTKCKNLRRDGPTPCWHPHCTCMYIGGPTCGQDARHNRREAEDNVRHRLVVAS